MLTDLFKAVLGTSLSLLPLILLLLACGPLLRKWYSPRLRHLLWLLVALRLLVPATLENAARFVIPAGDPVLLLEEDSAAVIRAFAEAQALAEGTGAAALAGGTATQPALSPYGLLAMVWVAGAAAFLLIHLAGYIRFRLRLRRWSLPATEGELLALEGIKKEIGLVKDIRLLHSAGINSPLLTGFIRPIVFLPAVTVEESSLSNVLRHELQHYKRWDLWYKLLLLVVGAIHWFNPAVFLMARRAEEEMELACDYAVLKHADIQSRRSYGLAMLSFLRPEQGPSSLLSTSFFRGKRQLKQRLSGIVDTSAKRKGAPLLCLLLAAVLFSATLIGCGSPEDIAASLPSLSFGDELPDIEETLPGMPEGEPVDEEYPIVVDEDAPFPKLPPNLEEMQELFFADLEQNQLRAQEAQNSLEEVYSSFVPRDTPYEGGVMQWPVPGFYMITSSYGWRYSGTDFHTGIDISGADIDGAPVVAAQGGTVVAVIIGDKAGVGYGNYIIVDHGDGTTTLYGQLGSVDTAVGARVEKGQVIGEVGSSGWSTGPHLHFEVRLNGAHTNPQPYITG